MLLTSDSTPIEETSIPRHALYHGKKVRLLEYLGHNMFVILDRNDQRRKVHRAQLTFMRGAQ